MKNHMGCEFHVAYFFAFFFNDTATTEIYTLSLHDALPILSKIFWLNKLTAQLGDTNYRVYGELEDAFEQKSLAQCHKIQHDTDKEVANLSGKELQDKLIAANQKMSDTVYNNTVELLGQMVDEGHGLMTLKYDLLD